MALEFARIHIIGRQAGHSAIKAAAYRAGERLFDQKLGQTANYSHRGDEVLHSQILLPDGADSQFSDRAFLWNAVEDREDQHNRRASAQLAKDHIIALPKELNHAQHVELIQDFANAEFVSKGLVVDLNIHGHSEGNPHAHLMVTTRALDGDQFGLKCRELNGSFYGGRKVPDAEMLKVRWADFQDAFFKQNEIDVGVMRNNGDYPAELHLGQAHAMGKDGKASVIKTENEQRVMAREAIIVADPSIVIDRVAARKSVFSMHDLTREASNLVRDSQLFAALKDKLSKDDSLVRLNPDQPDRQATFTTQSVIDTQLKIRGDAEQLSRADAGFSGINAEPVLSKNTFLSDEQREAVKWVCGETRLATVIGLAGAGKSTTLGVAREVLEAHGHCVRGIALAGKAAEELEKASGIQSSTIHSWLYAVEDGRESIKRGDVIVMDEAGMVDNALMHRVIAQVNQSGAKLVMVGDAEQLQPIQAGRPLRDLSHAHGYSEIATIRRQHAPWQRENTLRLARGDGDKAIRDYAARGFGHAQETQSEAIDQLVSVYLAGMANDASTHAVLAHSNAAVDAMNEQIRSGLIEQGQLRESRSVVLSTTDSEGDVIKRSMDIGIGDRVLFTKNDSTIGVKNGTLGEVLEIRGNTLTVKPDDRDSVSVDLNQYAQIKHGYAMTIHKSQGITVDRTSLLVTPTLNKHLGYVAMSRHRENANFYYGRDDFSSLEKLAHRFSVQERAESVTDFAQRHGVDLESGKTIDNGAPVMRVEDAKAILASARLSGIERSNTDANAKIETAQNALNKATNALDAHLENEPKTGLFARQATHAAWTDQRDTLEQQRYAAQRNVIALTTEREANQEAFSREARRTAAEQHPEAAAIVASSKAQEKATSLFEKIESLHQNINDASVGGKDAHRLRSLHTQLNGALDELKRDEAAQSKLTSAQAKTVASVRRTAAHEKEVRARDEQERGGHEL